MTHASTHASTQAERPCIRCGHCALACPAGLQPQQLYFFSRNEQYEEAASWQLFDCTECGACEAVCPSHIALVPAFQAAKASLRQQQAADNEASEWKLRFERHQARREHDALNIQERKLEKLQAKLKNIAEDKIITRQQEVPATPTPVNTPAPIAAKTPAQIKAEIEAAVARTRARKAALQAKTDSQDSES